MCKQLQILRLVVTIVVVGIIAAGIITGCSPIPLPKRASDVGVKVTGEAQKATDLSANTQSVSASVPKTKVAKKNLSPTQHVQQGIGFLKQGLGDKAKIEFESALKKQPDNTTAKKMLRQVNLSLDEYFKDKPVTKKFIAQPGDTFSTLAAKYLNDPLEFYILARFNHLEKSPEMEAGKIIKIPLVREVKKPKKPPQKLVAPVNVEYNLAKKYYDQGRFQSAIAVLEPRVQSQQNDFSSRDLLVLTYTKYAFYLVDKANLLEAQTVLEKAVSIQPNNRRLKSQLNRIEKQRNADRLYSDGVRLLKAGNNEKALDSFHQAVKLQPNHELAKKQIAKLQTSVIESLHKKAMTLYTNQELDDAIMNWDKVLKINPKHELAKLYRQRAIELKERLDKL